MKVDSFTLTSVYDLISGLDLIQQGLDLGDRFVPRNSRRIGIHQPSGVGKFLPELVGEKVVVSRCLGHDFPVRLSGVQRSEPAFKRQPASKSGLIYLP